MALSAFMSDEFARNARRPADYVCGRVVAGSSEQVTVPTGAVYARVSVSATMTIAFGANPTAVVVADTDDGTASEQITANEAEWFYVKDIAKIAFFGTGNVTVSFYKV